MSGVDAFLPGAPSNTPQAPRRADEDAFAQAPMTTDLHNPFIASDSVNNKAGGEFDDFPLFEEDTTQPLEPFPRITHDGKDGWEFFIRHPPKKKLTAQRYLLPIEYFVIRKRF